MIIESIDIENFRQIHNTPIPLGKNLTFISGQNGTGKSTLLGMLGQPFTFTVPDDSFKNFFGIKLKAEFSDLFNLSYHFDYGKNYTYNVNLYDETLHVDGKNVQVRLRKRSGTEMKINPSIPSSHSRFVTGKTHEKGSGNIKDIPVVYLSLSRVYPTGEDEVTKDTTKLTKEEQKEFITWHKKILLMNHIIDDQTSSNRIYGSKKDSLALETSNYDGFANSAGQDNLGKILASILLFKRLKKRLGNDYKGGILLIDEFETCLFPASQIKLFKFLRSISKELKIQIIATTHSITCAEYILKTINSVQSTDCHDIAYVHLKNIGGKTIVTLNPTFERMKADLTVSTIMKAQIKQKINVFREDKVAEMLTKSILGTKITKNLNFVKVDMSYKLLRKFSTYPLNDMKNALFVLDGDQKLSSKDIRNRVLVLPGATYPEAMYCAYLLSLSEEDSFWDNPHSYTKQVCFKDHNVDLLLEKIKPGIGKHKSVSNWYNQNQSHWGRANSLVISRWKQDNSKAIDQFKNQFIKNYNKLALRNGCEQIDKE
jgi:AAA15 family ATPase/GTPase